MSRGSSINFKMVKPNSRGNTSGVVSGYMRHNSREIETPNSIFGVNAETVQYDRSAEDALALHLKLLSDREEIYRKRTGQKVQKKMIRHISIVLNLDHWHTMEDMQRVEEVLEERFGMTVVQKAIHKDEGFWEGDTPHINFHGHFEAVGIDKEGESVRKKLTRLVLSNFQSEISDLLNMPRGKCVYLEDKKENQKNKRLDTYDYKAHKRRETETVAKKTKEDKLTIKKLKEENKRLRTELQEVGGVRVDFAMLEQEIKEVREQMELQKLQDSINYLTTSDFKRKLGDIQNFIDERRMEIELQGQGVIKKEKVEEKSKKELYYGAFKNPPQLINQHS